MDPSTRPQAPAKPGSPLVAVIIFLVIGALCIGCFNLFFQVRRQAHVLTTRGVLTRAHVISSYSVKRTVHADVMYTTAEGELMHESLSGCDFESLTPDMEYVHVLYDPEDPSFVRPAVCAGSTGLGWMALGGGFLFLALDAVLIRGFWRGRRSGA